MHKCAECGRVMCCLLPSTHFLALPFPSHALIFSSSCSPLLDFYLLQSLPPCTLHIFSVIKEQNLCMMYQLSRQAFLCVITLAFITRRLSFSSLSPFISSSRRCHRASPNTKPLSLFVKITLESQIGF